MIDFYTYQTQAVRTMNTNLSDRDQLLNMAMGLVCEAGELGDHIKKYAFQGATLDRAKVLEEAGDVLWYLAGLATVLGADIGTDIATPNLVKLAKRYQAGFSEKASADRVDMK